MSKLKQPPVFLRRPNLGHEGKSIRVRTNFFEVISTPRENIIHFDVTITPKVPPRLNRKIFETFVNDNNLGRLGGALPVYDGRNNMFAHKELPSDAFTVNVQLPEDDGAILSRRPPRNFEVKIRKVNTIIMDDLIKFLDGKGRKTDMCTTAIMALDALIRHQPSNLYVAVGSSFYFPKGSQLLSDGLEVWQGYHQSARPTRGRMMINVDLSATVFFPSGPLIQFVVKILGRRTPDDLHRGLNDRDRVKVENMIHNLRIRDNHRDVIRRKFKIIGLTPTPTTHTYFDFNGSRITVADYFFNMYRKRLIYPHLPCVITSGNQFLPMEVCDVIERQRYMRKLTDKQVGEMVKYTRVRPHDRENKIREGLGILNYRNNNNLRQFGMRISDNMEVVNARRLPPPTVQYNDSSPREAKFQPRDGAWNLKDKKVATGATLGSWSVLVLDASPEPVVRKFIRELVVTCQDTGMNIPNKNPPILHQNHQGDTEVNLKTAYLAAGNAARAEPQLIVCILPNTGNDLYAEIKRVGDTVIGIATQCIQSDHMIQPKKQYCANVCLKINVKLGGLNSFLDPHDTIFISEKKTIVFGADMTHPGPGVTDRPSIAAVCASLDARAARYAAEIRIQSGRSDIINDLADMVKNLLKTFYQTCGHKPERILFYRDGISEEQFAYVLEGEINAIKAACRGLDENYQPRITFAVVQKRHHTRFFPMDRREADRSGNCLPGTVVETGITHPFEFDYYLQSHAGLIGTSRPAHYHVLFDENGFDADKHQMLSYNLCYLYARCTRSVSLVPPVYYADLVCTRARYHLPKDKPFGEVKPNLQRVMYFM